MNSRTIMRLVAATWMLAACHQKTPEKSPSPSPTPSTPAPASPSNPSTPAPSPSISPVATSNGHPVFKSQTANDYVQAYDSYIDEFKEAYRAMKQGDLSKYQLIIVKAEALQTKGQKLEGDLSPEERRVFSEYLQQRSNDLAKFTEEAAKSPNR